MEELKVVLSCSVLAFYFHHQHSFHLNIINSSVGGKGNETFHLIIVKYMYVHAKLSITNTDITKIRYNE